MEIWLPMRGKSKSAPLLGNDIMATLTFSAGIFFTQSSQVFEFEVFSFKSPALLRYSDMITSWGFLGEPDGSEHVRPRMNEWTSGLT